MWCFVTIVCLCVTSSSASQHIKEKSSTGRWAQTGGSPQPPQARHIIPMLDLAQMTRDVQKTNKDDRGGLLQLTGTNEFTNFSGSISLAFQNLFTAGLVALAVALWVTVFVYWLSDKRSDIGAFQYSDSQYNDYNDYYQRVDKPYPSFSTRMSRVLEALSTDSMDAVLDTVRPTISRMESGVSNVGDLVTGGASAMAGFVTDQRLQDCLLQTVCYVSAPEDNQIQSRNGFLDTLGLNSYFEGRKKKKDRKERKEKKKEKKKKKKEKKKKEKLEAEYYSDVEEDDTDEDYYDEESDKDSITDDYDYEEDEEDEEEDDLEMGDCEVFSCGFVSFGHKAFKLYQKIQQIRDYASGVSGEK